MSVLALTAKVPVSQHSPVIPSTALCPPFISSQVGAFMMEHAKLVEWENIRSAVPAFLTIILMPLT